MGWGGGIVVVALTTAIGGMAAFGLSFYLISLFNITKFEGEAGYFTLFVILIGVAGGFVVGLITALTMRASFVEIQLRAAGVVLALTVAAGATAALSKTFEDKGPKLDGDAIRLEVEFRCPHEWKPDNALKAGHGGCFLQRYSDNGPRGTNPIVTGSLTWDKAPVGGEPWTISCAVPLEKATSPRYLVIYTSKSIEVTLQIPLPRHPSTAFQQWSVWSSSNFLARKGTLADSEGLAFRFRVLKESEYMKQHPSQEAAFQQARQKTLVAMPSSPTVADWLPFYENVLDVPTNTKDLLGPEVEAVNAHPEELLPLLRSEDMTVARRAVWATTFLRSVPPILIPPLTHNGLQLIQMIRVARAGALPNDPDELAEEKAWSYFIQWSMAMDHAQATATRREILEQVAAELDSGPQDESLKRLADAVKHTLEKLSQKN